MRRGVLSMVCVLAGASAALAGGETPPGVVYVDSLANPGGDGAAWFSAFRDLQDALDAAAAPGSTITEIRVATGTYTPARGTGDRDASFELVSGTAIVGGYFGISSPLPDSRDPALAPTVLSGDLARDDTPGGHRDDNSRNVVTFTGAWGVDNPVTLDGLTIRGGAGGMGETGSALQIELAHLTLTGCTIEDNTGVNAAAAWLRYCGPLTITDTVFRNNLGGGLDTEGCWEGTATACTFNNNTRFATGQSTRGGGAQFRNTRITLTGCRFQRNSADRGGGASLISADIEFRDCEILHNSASYRGGGLEIFGGDAAVIGSTIIGNTLTQIGGRGAGVMTSSARTDLVSCLLWANATAPGDDTASGGGIYTGSSLLGVTLTNCVLVENTSGTGGAARLEGPTGFAFCTVWNNHAAAVGGISESVTAPGPLLSACVLRENTDGGADPLTAQVMTARPVVAESSFIEGWPGETGGNSGQDPRLVVTAASGHPVAVLLSGSPCIDWASPAQLPRDDFDLDADGERFEPLPFDAYGGLRVHNGAPDAGATEFRGDAIELADLNGDGVVSAADLAPMLAVWGPCPAQPAPCPADLNGDGTVGGADLSQLISYWGK